MREYIHKIHTFKHTYTFIHINKYLYICTHIKHVFMEKFLDGYTRTP